MPITFIELCLALLSVATLGMAASYYRFCSRVKLRFEATTAQHRNELQKVHEVHKQKIEHLLAENRLALERAERSAEKLAQGKLELTISEEQRNHLLAVEALERRFQSQLQEARAQTLSVEIHPFTRKIRESGLITKTTEVEVGYKYQLLVQGIPCLDPHVIVVETLREKELDAARLEQLKTQAMNLAEAFATAKLGGIPKSIRSVVQSIASRK